MKVLTVDIGKWLKRGVFISKMLAFVLLCVLLFKLGTEHILNSRIYAAAISDAVEMKTVIIDAGHGGEDCGAIGKSGVYEKDLNLEISFLIGEMLSAEGYAVIYTRTTDRLLYSPEEDIYGIRKISDLKNRCKIGAEHPNAMFVSIHMNSFGNAKYSGLQVYYGKKNELSSTLATSIQSTVKSTLQNENNRSTKLGRDMYILENLDNPSVLIECGFLTNEEECKKLSEKEYQKQLSFAIVCGIIEYSNKVS